ncbi:MAG TPA: hypothetical protein VFA26_06615 [Gemmataceae bacterium]|nr:hypothetical protein [Gemmataceae bacterium]
MERDGGEVAVTRAVVPGRCVRLSGEAARVLVPGGHAACAEPRVEVLREGDVIRAIDVTCPCGQRIRLRCEYGQ